MLNVIDFRIGRLEAVVQYWPQAGDKWASVSRLSGGSVGCDLGRVRAMATVFPPRHPGLTTAATALAFALVAVFMGISTTPDLLASEPSASDFRNYGDQYPNPYAPTPA